MWQAYSHALVCARIYPQVLRGQLEGRIYRDLGIGVNPGGLGGVATPDFGPGSQRGSCGIVDGS